MWNPLNRILRTWRRGFFILRKWSLKKENRNRREVCVWQWKPRPFLLGRIRAWIRRGGGRNGWLVKQVDEKRCKAFAGSILRLLSPVKHKKIIWKWDWKKWLWVRNIKYRSRWLPTLRSQWPFNRSGITEPLQRWRNTSKIKKKYAFWCNLPVRASPPKRANKGRKATISSSIGTSRWKNSDELTSPMSNLGARKSGGGGWTQARRRRRWTKKGWTKEAENHCPQK